MNRTEQKRTSKNRLSPFASLRFRPGRFGRNILSNAAGNALHSIMQLGLLFALINIFDDRTYAAFLVATFLVGLLEMASDFGARIWATREFSTSKDSPAVLKRAVQCKAFYTLFSAFVLSLMPLNTLPVTAFWLCVPIACTQPGSDPILWFLRGRERLDIEAGVVLVFRALVVVAMLTMAFAGFGLNVLLGIWLLGNLLRMCVEGRLKVVRPLFTKPDATDAAGVLSAAGAVRYVFPVGSAFVLTSLFQRATVFLLDVFSTPQDVKFYGTAFKLVSTSGFVATSIFVSSFAMLARAIESQDLNGVRLVIRRKLMLVTLVFLPVCLVGILCAVPVSSFFESQDFTDIARVMVMLMPGLYVSCINMGLKYTLNAYELNWHDAGAVLVGIFVLCAATYFHGSLSWTAAAAAGWGLGEGALLMTRMGLLWSHRKHRGVPVGMILGSAVTLMFMVAITV